MIKFNDFLSELIIFTIFVFNLIFAQEDRDEFSCDFLDVVQEEIERAVQVGGRYITSFDTVRALMVFIDFSDDTFGWQMVIQEKGFPK